MKDDKQSEIIIMFDHTRQLLLSDEFLENVFMIFSKHDHEVLFGMHMNNEVRDSSSKQPDQTTEHKAFATTYRIMHS